MKMYCDHCNEEVEADHRVGYESGQFPTAYEDYFSCSVCGHDLDETEEVDTSDPNESEIVEITRLQLYAHRFTKWLAKCKRVNIIILRKIEINEEDDIPF